MPLPRNYRETEVNIADTILNKNVFPNYTAVGKLFNERFKCPDTIASLLYGSILDDDEEVISIKLSKPDADGIRALRFTHIKNKEPTLIIHS